VTAQSSGDWNRRFPSGAVANGVEIFYDWASMEAKNDEQESVKVAGIR
jgi:hypothetical protein